MPGGNRRCDGTTSNLQNSSDAVKKKLWPRPDLHGQPSDIQDSTGVGRATIAPRGRFELLKMSPAICLGRWQRLLAEGRHDGLFGAKLGMSD